MFCVYVNTFVSMTTDVWHSLLSRIWWCTKNYGNINLYQNEDCRNNNKTRSDFALFWLFQRRFSFGLVWLGLEWLGLVWGNIHLKFLWKFHQDLTWFGGFREDLELVWFAIVWIGKVWFDLRQHQSEASVKVSSRSGLFWLF